MSYIVPNDFIEMELRIETHNLMGKFKKKLWMWDNHGEYLWMKQNVT